MPSRPELKPAPVDEWKFLLEHSTACNAARIKLRMGQRGCVDSGTDGHFGGLLTGRAAELSITYARQCFETIAANLRGEPDDATIDSAVRFVLGDTSSRWEGLPWEERATFRGVCLPAVRKALMELRDNWMLARLDHSTATPESAEGTSVTPTQPATRAVDSSPDDSDVKTERATTRSAWLEPLLKRKRWTRGRLATEAGLSNDTVYNWANGTWETMKADNRTSLCDALGVPEHEMPA